MTLTNDEIQSLEAYRESRYPCPAVTTDVLIFTVRDTDLKVLLIRREDAPYQGQWSIPGGFLKVGDAYEDQGENLDEGAERVLREKTGLPTTASSWNSSIRLDRHGETPGCAWLAWLITRSFLPSTPNT